MDESQIKQDLEQWLVNFVEQSNPLLNNWPPCPYARQARLGNKINIVFDSPLEIAQYVSCLDKYDVVVLCFDHKNYSTSQIELFAKHLNSILTLQDYVVLEDHPDSEEFVNGVKMNFGKCGLMILQRLSKLNTAADQLRDKGYYTTWSDENLVEVVNWRYDLCKNQFNIN
jgi:hypothetical protein